MLILRVSVSVASWSLRLTSSLGPFIQFVMRVLLYPTPQGALTQLWAGTSPETANLNGEVILSILFTYYERVSRRGL
jgi:hypothetical protein